MKQIFYTCDLRTILLFLFFCALPCATKGCLELATEPSSLLLQEIAQIAFNIETYLNQIKKLYAEVAVCKQNTRPTFSENLSCKGLIVDHLINHLSRNHIAFVAIREKSETLITKFNLLPFKYAYNYLQNNPKLLPALQKETDDLNKSFKELTQEYNASLNVTIDLLGTHLWYEKEQLCLQYQHACNTNKRSFKL